MKISTIICRNAARINFSNSLRTHVFVILLFTFIITPGIVAQKFIDIKNFDLSVKPTDDFYEYANGGWMKNTPIPPDQSRWSSGGEIQERNYALLKNILESAAMNTSASKGSIVQKVGDFYYTGMDTNTIESQGATPLEEEFKTIQAITTTGQLIDEISNFHLTGAGLPFEFDARQDFKNSSQVIAQLYQGGLGLPDRDYYIKEDDQTKDIREKYAKHIANMFKLRGENEETASVDAKTVVDFETRLAKASMTQVEQRNLEAVYNILTLDELQKSTPNIPWGKFFSNIGLSHPGKLNVGQPKFLQEVNAMVNDVPLNDWKTYLRWHLINETAEYLSSAFVNEHFDFFGKTLTGQKELTPRWKRVLLTIDGNIGEALGQLFVDKAFSGKAKERALLMIRCIQDAFRDRIKNLDWMSEETKTQAIKKLDAIMIKIGYPDIWKDYSLLDIDRGSYVKNVLKSTGFEFKRTLAKIGKPVDRAEWEMTPQTLNAYYNPFRNEIVFPAGILQSPFFDAGADDAVNYGGIGSIIGHEITHGFDNLGRQFDAEGNMKNWWTTGDSANYMAKTNMLVAQYNAYVPVDTLHINGQLTLGENIADLGGLTIAFDALERSFSKNGHPDTIDGFTAEQRFFLAYAQVWRQNIRPEALRLMIATNQHSPHRYRCLGPISNMEEWAKAFGAKEGDPMVRKERIKIW